MMWTSLNTAPIGRTGPLAPVGSLILGASSLLALGACSSLPARPELPVEMELSVGHESRLDKLLEPAEAQHKGASGFRLATEGPEAFALRVDSGQLTDRTLDVQTYIWHDDLVGRMLAQVVLNAADRGVNVRILLDDMDARADNDAFAALAAHPHIEVRMFNPLASRAGTLAEIGDFMRSGKRLNHRMHNKTWIADNRVAIVGGRNLAEEYFGASGEGNYLDLEFVMIGPIVRDVSASFDHYWNSAAVFPIATLSPKAVTAEALVRLRTKLTPAVEEAKASRYADLLRRDDAIRRVIDGDWPPIWATEYRFVSDDPFKASAKPGLERSSVLGVLEPVMHGSQSSLSLMSGYFVPGKEGTAWLTEIAKKGVRVGVLTNSLAANDVASVTGGYSEYRRQLLEGGVDLWELKPQSDTKTSSAAFGFKTTKMHTKALQADGRQLFVGSYNLDPRSTQLNCEQGVLVSSPELAAQFDAMFREYQSPARAWRVGISDGQLSWTDATETFTRDPKASAGKRFVAWLARVFHVEAEL